MNRSPQSKRSLRGFTLTELMVVVTITTILSVIAIPNLRSYFKRSRVPEAVMAIGSFRGGMDSFFATRGFYPANLDLALGNSKLFTSKKGGVLVGFQPTHALPDPTCATVNADCFTNRDEAVSLDGITVASIPDFAVTKAVLLDEGTKSFLLPTFDPRNVGQEEFTYVPAPPATPRDGWPDNYEIALVFDIDNDDSLHKLIYQNSGNLWTLCDDVTETLFRDGQMTSQYNFLLSGAYGCQR